MNGCLAAERTHECGCGCVCVVNDSLGKHFAAPATTQISIRLLYITSRSSHLPLPSGTPTGRCKVESKCQIASQLGTASVWPSHVTCVPLCCPTRLHQTVKRGRWAYFGGGCNQPMFYVPIIAAFVLICFALSSRTTASFTFPLFFCFYILCLISFGSHYLFLPR